MIVRWPDVDGFEVQCNCGRRWSTLHMLGHLLRWVRGWLL